MRAAQVLSRALWFLLGSLGTGGAGGQFLSLPGCGEDSFSCPISLWEELRSVPPGLWHKHLNCSGSTECPASPGLEVARVGLPCCRHCLWSLSYPQAVPLVTPGRLGVDSEVGGGASDCFAWQAQWVRLDKDSSGGLNSSEFGVSFHSQQEAPWQLFFLCKKLQSSSVRKATGASCSGLNLRAIFAQVDLNRNGEISANEWKMFQHFIAPLIVSNSGPADLESTERQGRILGGIFVDQALLRVWHKDIVSEMLSSAILRGGGFETWLVREPVVSEFAAAWKKIDLDGSDRVSMGEEYFSWFADTDWDGALSLAEFGQSLYTGLGDSSSPQLTQNEIQTLFELHDMDGDGSVTFLERKFIASDLDGDQHLDMNEWDEGDFPDRFSDHCTIVPGKQSCMISREMYLHYLTLLECTTVDRLGNRRWAGEKCVVHLRLAEDKPFSEHFGNTPEEIYSQLLMSGWECWDRADANTKDCFKGYLFKILDLVLKQLQWDYLPVYQRKSEHHKDSLAMPRHIPGPDVLEIGLFSDFRDLHVPSANISCGSRLWKDDGLVIVKRTAQRGVNIESGLWDMARHPPFVNFFVFSILLYIVWGTLIWWVEAEGNSNFRRNCMGLWDGVWWASQTITSTGYGNLVPIRSLGKVIASLYMMTTFFYFGVLTAEVNPAINIAQKENSIRDPGDLKGLSVAVPSFLPFASSLVQAYSLNGVECSDMPSCFDILLNEGGKISALIAPHAEVLAYFELSRLRYEPCGNPAKIVGQPFYPPQILPASSMNSMALCAFTNGPYVAKIQMQELTNKVFALDTSEIIGFLQESANPLDVKTDGECEEESRYRWVLIACALSTMAFFALLVGVVKYYRRQLAKRQIGVRFLESYVIPALRSTNAEVREKTLARKYGERWLHRTRYNTTRRKKRIRQSDWVICSLRRLHALALKREYTMSWILSDLPAWRCWIERMLKFLTAVGVTLTIAVVIVVGFLIDFVANKHRIVDVIR